MELQLPTSLFIKNEILWAKTFIEVLAINPNIDLLLTLFKFNCSVNWEKLVSILLLTLNINCLISFG